MAFSPKPKPKDERMVPESCGNCKYWSRISNLVAGPVPAGVCRRWPPMEIAYGSIKNQTNGQLMPLHVSLWPTVGADKWCGEYKAPEALAHRIIPPAWEKRDIDWAKMELAEPAEGDPPPESEEEPERADQHQTRGLGEGMDGGEDG